MTDLLLPCWYRAVEVPGPREQKALFATFKTLLATVQGTLTVNTYMVAGRYYAVLFCLDETPPPEHEQKRLEATFAPYLPFLTLDETFLDALVRARLSKEPEIAADTRYGRLHVSHKQRPITLTDPDHPELSEEERTQRQQSWIATIEALLAEGKPFVEVFKMMFAGERLTSGIPLPQTDPFQANIFCQMLDHAQLWLWTASARQMYQDLAQTLEAFCMRQGWTTREDQLAHYNTLVTDLFQTDQRLWIEFDEPQPDLLGRVRAVFVYPRYPEQELNRLLDPREDLIAWLQAHQILGQEAARWNIDVIGENASVLLRLSYDTQYSCWVLPEDQYMSQVFAWTRWLAIATGMLHKRYARTPQVPAFPEHIASYQIKEQVPRKRGKGKPKDKWVTHSRRYTTVTYDLSEKPPIVRANDAAEDEHLPKRQNWLAQAQPDDLIYEQRVIDTFTRSYPTRKDGTRREGEVTVKHLEPKWVPLLRPALRKQQVIKKAVAKSYETSPVLPEQEVQDAHLSMPSVSESTEERRDPSC
ncbi:hypothetical protein KSD_42550 [Ktedonobacter sp. SOSP1-85]|uniref:hypothetical protein n=1 Tax=Ktedonobacter sp. SOSP1-85 TaxID=2778367 RepID=UPI0019169D7E|nr:hypothetical protein [Ktedonobacter sp. SOSP1-85]GHO76484.1 hypothetical protein KSD_42550 [Ktedonobacter sp. SOSP1-85]